MLKKAQHSRYEDFTTIGLSPNTAMRRRWKYSNDATFVDWIQDSILERNRRLRAARQANATKRGPKGEITFPLIRAQVFKAVSAAQAWLVISLAGVFRFTSSLHIILTQSG